ncbi:hypothetical protein DIPPA_02049 [Diplonema papillatum]|nr:hypothetical protein DIPPA_02049 [Diplonema papillatum]
MADGSRERHAKAFATSSQLEDAGGGSRQRRPLPPCDQQQGVEGSSAHPQKLGDFPCFRTTARSCGVTWGQDDCAKACHRTSADESFAERFYARRLKRQKHVAEAAVARFAPPCCGKKLNACSTRAVALRRQRHEKALAAL